MKNVFGIIFRYLLLCTICWPCNADVFADREGVDILDQKPEFLKKFGLAVDTRNVDDEVNGPGIKVTFTSFKIPEFNNYYIELLFLDSNNQLLLVIEKPFVNTKHTSSYILPSEYKLIVAVLTQVHGDSKYYRVSFVSDEKK
jgi:hypothetical protein